MTDEIGMAEMKRATENAVALLTALNSGASSVLDRQLIDAVEWVGTDNASAEGRRLALQLNQSTYLTKLALELVAESSGMTMDAVTARFGTLIAKFNLE